MKKILYLSLISIPVGVILLYVILLSFKLEDSQEHLVLDIPEGSSVSSVAQTLYEAKCFSKADIFAFKLAMKMSFKETFLYCYFTLIYKIFLILHKSIDFQC